ncbi:hypothetical protein EC973_004948 [Apophysomyces ossiformis]|uniref:Cytochrome P450 n=1 Tax=Apophysomyces ossiformis TaxID=679940 RepID=A0A8H7BPM2_9FUNG|nr:hypothetical protein EC973_004948 [Apophysomyces ossiformis]
MSRIILPAAAILTILAFRYPDRALFHEWPQHVPVKKGFPIVGSLPYIRKNKERIHDFIMGVFAELDTMTFAISSLGIPQRIITIDPRNVEHILKDNFENYVKGSHSIELTKDLLGDGIFNANGEHWSVFVEELQTISHYVLDKNKVVDFHDLMYKFTLESFVRIGFGVQLNIACSQEAVPFAVSFDALQCNSMARGLNPLWRLTEKLGWGRGPTIQDHTDTVNNFAANIIKQRRDHIAQGEEYHDLLSRFMQARNENKEQLDDAELRDVILNFIIAGRDTTAQALSWTFYNLMLHPRVQDKLLKEIHQKMPVDIENTDAASLFETIKNMTYAHAVFYEILRLHPPVPGNVRCALRDDTLPDGTPVKKGDEVSWNSYSLGRSEKIWGENAKQFYPERWINSDGSLRRESQGQWPVFHAGPRICLGQNLATLEALIAITYLLKQYKFSLVPGQDITYQLSLTLPMKNGVKMCVERR